MRKLKIIRATTVPQSLNGFCKGLLKELCEDYEVVAVSSPGPEMQVIAEREEVRTIGVAMERHMSPWNDLKSLWGMVRVFRAEKPHLVHSMTPKAGLICMLAAWLTGVPVRVHTFTGLVWPTAKGMKRRLLMLTDWLTCACATHVIPEGEGVKADLLRHGITRKPIAVLGYGNVRGIDLDYWKPVAPVKRDGRFTFVFVGRIVADKGMHELAEAMRRLEGKCRLVLVGGFEDELDPILPADRQFFQDSPHVELVGVQRDVRPFYAHAHALVFPSYREGFPNVVLEAGAMGLPSIVTDINGSREIIADGENGLIVAPHDAEALYRAMKRFIDNRDLVEQMAQRARPMVASRYEQGYVWQCLKNFYKEILADNSFYRK